MEPPAVEPSPERLRYRNRVTFTLLRLPERGEVGGEGSAQARAKTRVVAGFHAIEVPDRVVDVTGACLLPEEPIARAWEGLRSAWGEGAERLPRGPRLRLTLRTVGAGVVLVVDGGSGSWAPDALLSEVPGLVAIWHQESGALEPLLMAGDGGAHELWMGEPVRPGARAFLQVNRAAAERLHETVLTAVGPTEGRTLVDAYCGVGAYGRALARSGARVTGIERDPEAVAAARAGAPDGFTVLEGTVEMRLEEALPAELAILNPPRTGLEEAVVARLSTSWVSRIVYVSCDPATLARDVSRLGGYRLTGVRAFDLFPQTAHVETLAMLESRDV